MGFYYEDYEKLPIGHRWMSPGKTIAESDINTFAGLTGDHHPLHTDAHFSAKSEYGARIAHGYLTASVASGLAYRVGLDENTSFAVLATGWKFKKPVMIGDTIRVEIVMTELRPSKSHPDKGIVSRRYDVMNQRDEIVAVGEIAILCLRKPSNTI
jgi:acyl dehydratase